MLVYAGITKKIICHIRVDIKLSVVCDVISIFLCLSISWPRTCKQEYIKCCCEKRNDVQMQKVPT